MDVYGLPSGEQTNDRNTPLLQPAGSSWYKTVFVVGTAFGTFLGAALMTPQSRERMAKHYDDLTSLNAMKDRGRTPLKILFVGNSFTYGPAPSDRADQLSLNNVPKFFQLISESMNEPVLVGEDTLGGCTLYAAHRPSVTPESQNCTSSSADCVLISTGCPPAQSNCTPRVMPEAGCTVPAGIAISPSYHPCPQLFERQPYGAWDVISLQDMSNLPTVKKARELYLYPAVKEVAQGAAKQAEYLKKIGKADLRFGKTMIAAYNTWAYFNGSMYQCPGDSKKGCFPLGGLDELSNCAADDSWHQTSRTVACQEYALARGYASTLEHGADLFIPAGLANLAARKEQTIPAACKAAVDKEYTQPGLLAHLDLPLKVDTADALWSGKNAHELFRYVGKVLKNADGSPKYCTDKCKHDHHGSTLAMYLNALVFFATIFKTSPVGAAYPNGQTINGMLMPKLDPEQAKTLQRIAAQIVLPHLDVWWNSK